MNYHLHPTPEQIWCGLIKAGVYLTDAQWAEAMAHAGEAHAEVKHNIERALFEAQSATTRMNKSLGITEALEFLRNSEAA